VEEGAFPSPGNPLDSQHFPKKDGQIDSLENFDDFAGTPKDEGFF